MHDLKLHFQRFEFKYFLTFDEFREIRKRLSRFVRLDGHAKDSRAGFYDVVSLYYDSPKFYYYNEKQDGVRNRKKIRLRRYTVDGAPAGPMFFEIKRKFDAVILKDRFAISREAHDRLVLRGALTLGDIGPSSSAERILEEFDAERFRKSLEPKILVRYRREPYLGRFNQNFRVTFDYDLSAVEGNSLFASGSERSVLPDGVIMEIKFNGRLPHYIREIIESYSLERTAYSKYCKAAEVCFSLGGIRARHCFFPTDVSSLSHSL